MLKIVLIASIFLICIILGYLYGEKFRKRFVDLSEAYKNIILLQNEVVYNNTPLPEALRSVGSKAKENFGNVMKEVSDNLEQGVEPDVYVAFKNSYIRQKENLFLSNEDTGVLSDFFKSLGESGVYGQEKIFKLVLENLKININEANEISKRNTKLCRYLGVCFGGMISIFLL